MLAVADVLADTLRAGSAYLQERVADLKDGAPRLVAGLYGEKAIWRVPVLTRPSILVAADRLSGTRKGYYQTCKLSYGVTTPSLGVVQKARAQ